MLDIYCTSLQVDVSSMEILSVMNNKTIKKVSFELSQKNSNEITMITYFAKVIPIPSGISAEFISVIKS